MGWGFVFSETATPPPPQGAGSQRSPFGGFPSIYVYTLCRRITNFDVATYVGERRVSSGQPRHPSQDSVVPALPILEVLLYFYVHSLTQNDQIRHGNTSGVACFSEVSRVIGLAQVRRAVCQRQLSFLFLPHMFSAQIQDLTVRILWRRFSKKNYNDRSTWCWKFCPLGGDKVDPLKTSLSAHVLPRK